MNVYKVVVVLSVSCSTLALGLGEARGDALWDKAVALARASEAPYPRTMKEHEKTYDRSGKLKQTVISTYAIGALGNQGGRAVLRRSTKDGKDNTSAKRKELKDWGEDGKLLNVDNLFHPAAQTRVKTQRLSHQLEIGGVLCAVYDYSHRTSDGLIKGRAYLDAASGAPLKTQSRAAKVPVTHGKLKVNSVKSTTFYTRYKGQLRVARIAIATDFEYDGFLFFNFSGVTKTQVTFSDYR